MSAMPKDHAVRLNDVRQQSDSSLLGSRPLGMAGRLLPMRSLLFATFTVVFICALVFPLWIPHSRLGYSMLATGLACVSTALMAFAASRAVGGGQTELTSRDSPLERERALDPIQARAESVVVAAMPDVETALAHGEAAAGIASLEQMVSDLRRSEVQYRSFFDNAVEGIFQTTPEGRYVKANPMLARIYGYESSEELMSGLTDIGNQLYVDPHRREAFMRILQEKDAVWGFESEVCRRDQKVIWISENARAIRTPDQQLLGYAGTVVDITERKRQEAELARARARETQIGSRIQQTLLLGQPPRNLAWVSVSALTIPSQEIDGDFYDFFTYNDRSLDIVVGDVMGKGVPAALVGAGVKSRFYRALSTLMFSAGTDRLPQPDEIVSAVHSEATCQFIGLRYFLTLCYIRFDQQRGQVSFVDCGHTKTIHYRRSSATIELLQGDNLPLGCSEQEVYRQVSAPYGEGDLFCFYSDGVTEARSADGELFGAERLAELVAANADLEPDEMTSRVRQAITDFTHSETFTDDLTCVVVKIKDTQGRTPMAHAELTLNSDLAELATMRAFVRHFCREVSLPALDDDSMDQLELAAQEAASNIMKHAYHGRTDQWVQVQADALEDRISVRFNYFGDPFDPAAAAPPAFDGTRENGFGVYIIGKCVDEVRYTHEESGQNSIYLVKNRRGPH